jgi:hypothetical protein
MSMLHVHAPCNVPMEHGHVIAACPSYYVHVQFARPFCMPMLHVHICPYFLSMLFIYPIKADSHFFWPILLKLAGNVKNGKNSIPLFLFFFKMKINEDIRD